MTRPGWRALAYLGVWSLLLAGGCARDGHGRQKVSGTVTWGGQPLREGTIEFFPAGGPPGPAAGALIRNGAYAVPKEQGLAPGAYRVTIRSPVVDRSAPPGGMSSPPTREQVPARYNARSELTADVRAGEPNRFDFHLEP
jgi:hypothetical protein